ncbi:MAG: restriction endonuclease subunit S [Azospirillum sp.]|nr:restriction endonuclease subunit S [Azospirillum sp.]
MAINGDWAKATLNHLCSLITDGKHGDCRDEAGSGYYFLSVKDIFDNRMVYDNARQITKADFLETHQRTNLCPGDILFTNTGTIGRMAIAPDDARTSRTTFQKSVAVLKPRGEIVLPLFLYYCLKFENSRLSDLAAGTTQKNLLLRDFRTFDVSIPSRAEQQIIVAVLGVLDDKIELNRRMNETLEAMARAIFKDWFVDFGPTRAKAEGRPPYLAPDLWSLFPHTLDDDDKPAEWPLTTLEMVLAAMETGGRPKGGVSNYKFGVPSVGAESIVGLGKFDFSKTKYIPDDFFADMKKGHVKSRDVILYKDGGRPGEFEPHLTLFGDGFPFDKFAINEHVYRLRAIPDIGQPFLFFWLSSDFVMEEMRIKGTGVAIPGLNSTQVKSLTTLMPPVKIVSRFNSLVEPIITEVLANCKESRTLAQLRDLLLPKLMSGEIRLKDAEKVVEKVA